MNIDQKDAGLQTYLRERHDHSLGSQNNLRYFFAPANTQDPRPTEGFPIYRDGNKAMRELNEQDESTLDFVERLRIEIADTVQLYVGIEQEGKIKTLKPFREKEIDLKRRQERLEDKLHF